MIATTTLLAELGDYLAAQQLAQYTSDGDYSEDPGRPAVVFGPVDVPDTILLLAVTAQNSGLSLWDLGFTFRGLGRDPLAVEGLADAVADHFEATMGMAARTWVDGTAVAMPFLTLGELKIRGVERLTRGPVELTSESKYQGQRFTRTDVYRLAVRKASS